MVEHPNQSCTAPKSRMEVQNWKPTGQMSAKGLIPGQMLQQSSRLFIGGGIKKSPSPRFLIPREWLLRNEDWISTKATIGSKVSDFLIASRLTA